MRIATVLMGLLFLFGALVQYNDPDPLRWIAVYLAAAAVSFGAHHPGLPWWLPAGAGAIALLWVLVIGQRVDAAAIPEIFAEFEMESIAIEEAREALGLVIVAAWMGVVAGMRWKRRA